MIIYTLSESDPEKSPTLLGLLWANFGHPFNLFTSFRERFPLVTVFQLNSVLTELATSRPTVLGMLPDIDPIPSTLPPQVLQEPSAGCLLFVLNSNGDDILPGQVQ